jgi:phage gpG-like protein
MRFSGVDSAISRFERLQQRLDDSEVPLSQSGDALKGSIEKNFDASGRPTWPRLAASTLAARRRRGTGDTPLVERGDLKGSIHAVLHGDSIEVGTDKIQARRLNFGYLGGVGRGHSRTPARPFVMFQDEDKDAVANLFSRHYKS